MSRFFQPREVVLAGIVGGVVGGLPSTCHALLTGRSAAEATLAAGTVLFPGERRAAVLVPAAAALHSALSLGWAAVLAATLPDRRMTLPSAVGVACAVGTGIAIIDLGILGRHYPRVVALPIFPQVADHMAYALGVCLTLRQARTCVR